MEGVEGEGESRAGGMGRQQEIRAVEGGEVEGGVEAVKGKDRRKARDRSLTRKARQRM
jgi:hypothetical protein